MKKRKIWVVGISGLTALMPLVSVVSCGNNSGGDNEKTGFAVYSDKMTNINSLIGLAYKIEVLNTKATEANYDEKDAEHGNALLNKEMNSLHKHVEQQSGQTPAKIVSVFKEVNLNAIYNLVEAVYGKGIEPVFTVKVAEVGKAVEAFNKSDFTLPTASELTDLSSAFTNIKKYAEVFGGWTNRKIKLEIVARDGDNYKTAKTEAEAKALAQDIKLAKWYTHKDNTEAIYDKEFIVRVVAE